MQSHRWASGAGVLGLAVSVFALVAVAAPSVAGPEDGSAALGKVTYRAYCTSCHGAEGKGDGTLAGSLPGPRPSDLTQLARLNGGTFPADRVRQAIDGRKPREGHPRSEMPAWGEVFTTIDPLAAKWPPSARSATSWPSSRRCRRRPSSARRGGVQPPPGAR